MRTKKCQAKFVFIFTLFLMITVIANRIAFSQQRVEKNNDEDTELNTATTNSDGNSPIDVSTNINNNLNDGFVPKWNVGDKWVVEATYKDIRQEGDVWLPPILWVFKVRGIKSLHRQKCYVVHVYPADKNIKQQAILYLSTFDLRVLKVIDIYPTRDGAKAQERFYDPFNPQPLIAENTLIPYDLPLFPLLKPKLVQDSDGIFKGYRSKNLLRTIPKIIKIGEFSFKKVIKQNQKNIDTKHYADQFRAYSSNLGSTYQVELIDENNKDTLVQVWQEGLPWAISADSGLKRMRLISYKTKLGSGDVRNSNLQPQQEGE